MVSKQSKNLRQQAAIRAEKYKEEQAQKARDNAAKIAQASGENAAAPATDIHINPATGRKVQAKGNAAVPWLKQSTHAGVPVLMEKKSMKKALASIKKERHTPIAPAPHDDHITARRTPANARRAGAQSKSTAYNIAGGMVPEEVHPPVLHVPRTPLRNSSGNLDGGAPHTVDNYGNPLSPIASWQEIAQDSAHNEPVKVPFFTAFTKTDPSSFTFDLVAPLRSNDHARLVPNFQFPQADIEPTIEPVKQDSGSTVHCGRSIFDVMRERAKTEADASTLEAGCAAESSDGDQIASCHKSIETSNGPLIPSSLTLEYTTQREVSLQLPVRSETSQNTSTPVRVLIKSKVEHSKRSRFEYATRRQSPAEAQTVLQSMALVLYQPATCKTQSFRTGSAVEPRPSERLFFADIDGYTRLVDLRQTLYDIDITNDDGNSDFDSIASPIKSVASLVRLESPIKTFHEEVETSSSDDSDEDVDMDDLSDSFRIDCTFLTHEPETAEGNGTPDTLLSFSEDEDVIDPRLELISPQIVVIGVPAKNTDELISPASHISSVSDDDQDVLHEDLVMRTGTNQLLGTEILTTIGTAYTSLSNLADRAPADLLPSAWTSELVRTTLGTESLFTFLSQLQADDTGTTTKLAITTTFLKLVKLEREKLEERALPPSYTAGSVMASIIMPYTIFLGTTSLASFLSHLDDETTVGEVHRVFMMLSKKDVRFRETTTTGLMGALGGLLGRLPAM